jgi:single-stranded-DNA-specific exonuclease
VAFYLTPLINALIRVGTMNEKEKLFESFINGTKEIPSTKRGESGLLETVSVQSVRNCVNAKSKQNREKEKAMELLDIQILENCLDENKILILNADELDVPNSLTGLIAMGVSAKYKKPVLLGRTSPDGFLKGSGRGRNGSELQDFRQFLLDSGYMDFAEGHSQAFGQSVKISNIDKLTNYANYELADINFNEGFYEADFVVNGNYPALSTLIEEMDKGKALWSQGNDEPIIIIKNIQINKNEISVIGKNHDTIRLIYNGITYIKFKAEEIIKMLDNISDDLMITIAGRANINEWGGQRKPQILADEMEIIDVSF